MNNESRRKDDRHPDRPLDWSDTETLAGQQWKAPVTPSAAPAAGQAGLASDYDLKAEQAYFDRWPDIATPAEAETAQVLTDELESLMDSLSIARTSLPPGGVEQAKKALRSLFARMSTPAAPVEISGLGRITNEDDGYLTLQFKDEGAACQFMRDYAPSVEVDDMPPLRDSEPSAQVTAKPIHVGTLSVYEDKETTFGHAYDISTNMAGHKALQGMDGYELYAVPGGQSPAPVTAEPAKEQAIIARVQAAICDANNGADIYMASMIAASRIMGDLAASPATNKEGE